MADHDGSSSSYRLLQNKMCAILRPGYDWSYKKWSIIGRLHYILHKCSMLGVQVLLLCIELVQCFEMLLLFEAYRKARKLFELCLCYKLDTNLDKSGPTLIL